MMNAGPQQLKENYLTQLDTLRALAVSMVVFSHWAGYHENMWSDDLFWLNGEVGVKTFFIISGFLITGILLKERQTCDQFQSGKAGVLKQFYIRRFLRIFPVYYATIFLTLLLGHPDVRASWMWHVTYMSNILFAIRGEYLGDVSHFWSLAVEEQFYLAWPVMILFLPRRYLLPFIVFCIGIAPLFRYVAMFIFHQNDVTVSVLPVSCMDCLSAGALIAYLQSSFTNDKVRNESLRMVKRICLASAIAYIGFNLFAAFPVGYEWYAVFVSRLLMVPTLLGVVLLFIGGFSGVAGRISSSRVLTYPGKISYGIYLFHFFIPGATYWIFAYIGWTPPVFAILLINIFVLLALASLSWHLLEDPINRLKSYFPYVKKHDAVIENMKPESI